MNAVTILQAIGRPIAYYPKLAKPLGGVTPAVLFSQLFYWQDKASSELGVYKTRDEIEEETGLTHHEQRTAIKKLVGLGILLITEKRIEHKTYYKIDNEKVNVLLADFANSIIRSSRPAESECPELHNVDVGSSTKSSSLDQEITTKITTKNTTNNIIGDSSPEPKRACQLPDDFMPKEAHYVLAKKLGVHLDNEFEHFRDHHLARGSTMKDWNFALNTWLRQSVKFNQPKSGYKTRSERNMALLETPMTGRSILDCDDLSMDDVIEHSPF